MKPFLVAGAYLAFMATLAAVSACQEKPKTVDPETVTKTEPSSVGGFRDMRSSATYVYQDPVTKCWYIGFQGESGITARLGGDGRPMCGGAPPAETATGAPAK